MSLSDAEFGHLFNKLGTEGGFSVNPNTGKPPSSGVMVGQIGSGSTSPISETTPDTIKDYEQSRSWSRSDDYMGGWRSEGSGRDAFDVSRNVRGKPTVAANYGPDVARADARTSAEDLALYNNQDAVYDVDTGKDPNTMGIAELHGLFMIFAKFFLYIAIYRSRGVAAVFIGGTRGHACKNLNAFLNGRDLIYMKFTPLNRIQYFFFQH